MSWDKEYYRKQLLELRPFERLNFNAASEDATTIYRFTGNDHPILTFQKHDQNSKPYNMHDFKIYPSVKELKLKELICQDIWESEDRLSINEKWCSNISKYKMFEQLCDYRAEILKNEVDETFSTRLFGNVHNSLKPVLRLAWMCASNNTVHLTNIRNIVYNWIAMVTLQYYCMTRGQFLNCIGEHDSFQPDESYPPSIFAIFVHWDFKHGDAFTKDWTPETIDDFVVKHDFSSLLCNVLTSEAPRMDKWIREDQEAYRSRSGITHHTLQDLHFTSQATLKHTDEWVLTKFHNGFKKTFPQSRFALIPIKDFASIIDDIHDQESKSKPLVQIEASRLPPSLTNDLLMLESRKRKLAAEPVYEMTTKYRRSDEVDNSNNSSAKTKSTKGESKSIVYEQINDHCKSAAFPLTKDYAFGHRGYLVNTADQDNIPHKHNSKPHNKYTCQIPFFYTHFYFTNLAPICSQHLLDIKEVSSSDLLAANVNTLWNISRVSDDKTHENGIKRLRTKSDNKLPEIKELRKSTTQNLNPVRLRHAYTIIDCLPYNPVKRCIDYNNTRPEYCCNYMNPVSIAIMCQKKAPFQALSSIVCDPDVCNASNCFVYYLQNLNDEKKHKVYNDLDGFVREIYTNLILLLWSLIIHLKSEKLALNCLYVWINQTLPKAKNIFKQQLPDADDQHQAFAFLSNLDDQSQMIVGPIETQMTRPEFLQRLQHSESLFFDRTEQNMDNLMIERTQLKSCLESWLRFFKECDDFESIPFSEMQVQFIEAFEADDTQIVRDYVNMFLCPHYIKKDNFSRLNTVVADLVNKCPKSHTAIHRFVNDLQNIDVYEEIKNWNSSEEQLSTPNVLLQTALFVYDHLDKLFSYAKHVPNHSVLKGLAQVSASTNVDDIVLPVNYVERQTIVQMINGFAFRVEFTPQHPIKILVQVLADELMLKCPLVERSPVEVIAQIVYSATHRRFIKKFTDYIKEFQCYKALPETFNGLRPTKQDHDASLKPFEKLHIEVCRNISLISSRAKSRETTTIK